MLGVQGAGTPAGVEGSGSKGRGLVTRAAAGSNEHRGLGTGEKDSISDLHRSKHVGSVGTYVCTAGGQLT